MPTGTATTPEERYDKCISVVCPENKAITDAIIGWHELLLRYVQRDGAVLLTRLYESQKDTTGVWDNRRNALTISQNYQYAFCSNHFPRLILTMALNGFVPEDDDFWDMLVTNREFYLSALFGMAPIEKRIAACETKAYKAAYYNMRLNGKKGWEAKAILNSLGIDTSRGSKHKGLLLNSGIDDAIKDAIKNGNDSFKTALEEIKERGLHLRKEA